MAGVKAVLGWPCRWTEDEVLIADLARVEV